MSHAMPRDHKGDYGIDGSFHTISARGQAISIGVGAAALAATSAISAKRGKRLVAALDLFVKFIGDGELCVADVGVIDVLQMLGQLVSQSHDVRLLVNNAL